MLEMFYPSEYHESVFDIDFKHLKSQGYIGLLFDIDNTLVPYDELDANDNIVKLFKELKEMGFKICLVSNNNRKRVYRFNQNLKVHAIYNTLKPLRRKLRKGMSFLGTDLENTVLIGDQMFTDVLGGNRLKIKTILVKPIQDKEQWITKVKRNTEKKLFDKYIKSRNNSAKSSKIKVDDNTLGNGGLVKICEKTDGKTKSFGLIGCPISHTKSPFIHNMFSEVTGINMVYLPFLVKEGEVPKAIEGAKALHFGGLNVTVPHKKEVIQCLDYIDPVAKQIGAVNTLHFTGDEIKGYNTDIVGLGRDLKANQVDLKSKVVCVLGAGGAANAVAILCAKSGAQKIYIVNRTLEKAENLKAHILKHYNVDIECLSYDNLMAVEKIDVCFQTTSLGMTPNIDRSPISAEKFFDKVEVAVDIVYTPKETLFLKQAKEHGAKVINGLGMLFYQGLEAFEIWNGIKLSEEQVRSCYKKFDDFVYLEKK